MTNSPKRCWTPCNDPIRHPSKASPGRTRGRAQTTAERERTARDSALQRSIASPTGPDGRAEPCLSVPRTKQEAPAFTGCVRSPQRTEITPPPRFPPAPLSRHTKGGPLEPLNMATKRKAAPKRRAAKKPSARKQTAATVVAEVSTPTITPIHQWV